MITTDTSMSWGDELAPLEMQNINGGDWVAAGLIAALLDFLYNVINNGGNWGEALGQVVSDIEAAIAALKNLVTGLEAL